MDRLLIYSDIAAMLLAIISLIALLLLRSREDRKEAAKGLAAGCVVWLFIRYVA